MRYCTSCGAAMQDDQRFCTACGTPIPSVDEPPVQQGGGYVAPPEPEDDFLWTEPPEPKKKRSRALPIVLIALLVTALAVFAVWFFLLRDGSDDSDGKDEKTEQNQPRPKDDAPEAERAESVRFELKHDGDEEYAVITGCDEDGESLWKVETPRHPTSQLRTVQEIGIENGVYYYIEGGDVVTLNLAGGTEAWRNDEFGGSPGDWVFDDDGTLYLCGYLGPDLFVVAKDGKTVKRIATLNEDFYWPYDIRFIDSGGLRITFEMAGDGEGAITLDPDTYKILSVEGESPAEPERGMPRSITLSASSVLKESGYDYSATCAMDGNSTTAWAEAASGDGVEEWLRLDFGEDCGVSGLQIWAGYQKSDSLFQKNNRPKSIRVTFSDGSSMDFELDDTMNMQSLSFGGKRVTSSLKITILSVYPGTAYQDTCITELALT